MAISNFTTLANIIKELWPNYEPTEETHIDSPLYAMIPRDEKAFGNPIDETVKYAGNAGASNTFSTAQTNASASSIAKFQFSRTKKYSVAKVDRELAICSKDKAAALIDAVTLEVDGATRNVVRKIQHNLYRDNTGVLGKISSGSDVTSATITLDNTNDIWNFFVGQKVIASAAGATARGSTGTIASINTDSGTITLSAHWDDATSAVAGDYICAEGDVALDFYGLGSLIPVSTPSGTFCNVNRSLDPVRLGGGRLDGSSLTIKEAISQAAYRAQLRGATKADYCLMNPLHVEKLTEDLGDKVRYGDSPADAKIGFETIKLQTPHGVIEIVGDPSCPTGYAWQGPVKATLKLRSALKAPHIFNDAGEPIIASSEDAYEFRVGAYCCVTCREPNAWTAITLPSL